MKFDEKVTPVLSMLVQNGFVFAGEAGNSLVYERQHWHPAYGAMSYTAYVVVVGTNPETMGFKSCQLCGPKINLRTRELNRGNNRLHPAWTTVQGTLKGFMKAFNGALDELSTKTVATLAQVSRATKPKCASKGNVCKYCGSPNGSLDPNVLCMKCRSTFGHTYFSEL